MLFLLRFLCLFKTSLLLLLELTLVGFCSFPFKQSWHEQNRWAILGHPVFFPSGKFFPLVKFLLLCQSLAQTLPTPWIHFLPSWAKSISVPSMIKEHNLFTYTCYTISHFLLITPLELTWPCFSFCICKKWILIVFPLRELYLGLNCLIHVKQ